jgi:4-diphosphocytidyl-2-C-methyl-D-erythritol kinase
MSFVRLLAPAKINLTLEVLARRADGFHGVRSLMVPLELADELVIAPHLGGFTFACDQPALEGPENLVVRAFEALQPADRNVRIELRKRIPVEAGLGGGSSDAAAVLLAAMDGAFGPPPQRDYLALARSIGSDVPFFLVRTGALVEGSGERVTAAGALPPWFAIIVCPPARVATARAYVALDARELQSRPRASSLSVRALEALQRGDLAEVEGCMHNDFQSFAESAEPAVSTALTALREAGAHAPLLTGSGACVFALAEDRAAAETIASGLRQAQDDKLAGYEVFVSGFAATPAWR